MKKVLFIIFLAFSHLMAKADNLNVVVNHAMDGGATGEIYLSIVGGMAPYTIEWTGPAGFTSSSTSLSGLVAGVYHVKVTDRYCGVAEMDVVIEAKSTSIEDNVLSWAKIYPNPAQEVIHIETLVAGKMNIEVFNVLGQKMMMLQSQERLIQLDISDFVKGHYLIKLSTEEASVTTTFIKL